MRPEVTKEVLLPHAGEPALVARVRPGPAVDLDVPLHAGRGEGLHAAELAEVHIPSGSRRGLSAPEVLSRRDDRLRETRLQTMSHVNEFFDIQTRYDPIRHTRENKIYLV